LAAGAYEKPTERDVKLFLPVLDLRISRLELHPRGLPGVLLTGSEGSPDVAAIQMKIVSCRQPCTLDLGGSRALESVAMGIEVLFALRRLRNASEQRAECTAVNDAESLVTVRLKTE
jgi:hypothetical protein